MCVATRDIMDFMFEACLDASEPDDIPDTNEPVWILGKKYNAKQGMYGLHIISKTLNCIKIFPYSFTTIT